MDRDHAWKKRPGITIALKLWRTGEKISSYCTIIGTCTIAYLLTTCPGTVGPILVVTGVRTDCAGMDLREFGSIESNVISPVSTRRDKKYVSAHCIFRPHDYRYCAKDSVANT
jgi:hypothetical protein